MKTKGFVVSGYLKVTGGQMKAADGRITGYKQKDGSIIRPILALEIEKKDKSYEYLITPQQMRRRGFEPGPYDKAHFED